MQVYAGMGSFKRQCNRIRGFPVQRLVHLGHYSQPCESRQLNYENIFLQKLRSDDMMTNVMFTRQKILAFLKKQNVATAAEIGAALQMTAANARHHLAQLQADGLVEVVSVRGGGKRGRPQKVYRLGKAVLGENFAEVLDALLSMMPPEEAEARLESVGRALAEKVETRTTPLMRRLAQAVGRLNRMSYQARWEATPVGPRVVLGNCPYATLIEKHPALCRMDAALLHELLGEPVKQTAKLERTELGNIYCAFHLKN